MLASANTLGLVGTALHRAADAVARAARSGRGAEPQPLALSRQSDASGSKGGGRASGVEAESRATVAHGSSGNGDGIVSVALADLFVGRFAHIGLRFLWPREVVGGARQNVEAEIETNSDVGEWRRAINEKN